jgi:hypothetical protein
MFDPFLDFLGIFLEWILHLGIVVGLVVPQRGCWCVQGW